jgi:hypothetical protein
MNTLAAILAILAIAVFAVLCFSAAQHASNMSLPVDERGEPIEPRQRYDDGEYK